MIKNITKVLLSNFLLAITGVVSSFIFPMLLSVIDYAYYQEYMLYLSYINICHLGLASGMFLNYAGSKYNDIDREQYKSEILLLFLILISFTLIFLIASGATKSVLLLYITISIFPQCLLASFYSLYQSWGRFTEYSILNIIPKVLLTIFVLLMYIVFKNIKSNYIIIFYIVVIWIITIYFIFEFFTKTKNSKSNSIISKRNISTLSSGFLITLGNYINTLFCSIDKQFVNIFYDKNMFAYYSFAMAMQNIMTIFITSISSPLYASLASKNYDSKKVDELKNILLIFGTYSGCALFIVKFFIENFIIKYSYSINIISIFFAVFPAMTLISVIYINLYKIEKKLKKYIVNLITMVFVSLILNGVSVYFKLGVLGIAYATMLSYYIWLIIVQKDFDYKLVFKDYLYIGLYLVLFLVIRNINNSIFGFIIYFNCISLLSVIFYKKIICNYIKKGLLKFARK